MRFSKFIPCSLLLCAALTLSACGTLPKNITGTTNPETLAKAANTAIDGTASALETGTGKVSGIDAPSLQGVTQAPAVADAANPVGDRTFKDAVLSPLSDLNIRRREFPELLAPINSPYDPIGDDSCAGLSGEIAVLDEILGPDIDISDEELGESTKLKSRAKDVSIAGVASAAGGFIPGRSVIREATGAGERDRSIRADYQKGVARRSYLKGISFAKGCAGK